MKQTSRRRFLATLTGGGAMVLTARKGFTAQTRALSVRVRPSARIGMIKPELHGQFAEHLGNCTYEGLWVGPQSKIPNIRGYRRQAVEYLRALGIPVLRWPGGCFADDYHWRDGIGPVEKRPRRVNLWWGQYTEDNSFGTHEFMGLCRLIGAEPYFAGNVGSGTPQELRDWVEYCNFPAGSTLAEERKRNGAAEPFRVRYWGVGNENWGCGGNLKAQEYATLYRQFATYLLPRGGIGETPPFLIACGPSSNDLNWTRNFFDNMAGKLRMLHGYAMHFYSNGKSAATKFTVETMREQLATYAAMEKAIVQQRALMDSYDPDRRIGLLIDEWGVWDRIPPEDEKRYGRLFQQITIRSAIAAALGLNVFHRQAEKLIMGNIAQTVNVLHAILLTDQDKCIRTPAYYAFELLKPHRGGTSVAVDCEDNVDDPVSASASLRGRDVIVTLVNPSHDTAVNITGQLDGIKAASVTARTLYHADLNACNTFENPDLVVPQNHPASAEGERLTLTLPPLSVNTVSIRQG